MSAASQSTNASTRRPWSPDRADHLIYNWVKMEGKTQAWVSQQFKIDQSTVSRLIQRYERWQAHAREREGGRLDNSERLRAQRWLTFERNELLLGSCMRIAKDMEGFIDTSKSTISHPLNDCTKENAVSTVHATIDRTGAVARFLRLAFRINMEQLKLASLDPPPQAADLTDEELDQQDLDIATFTKELAAFGLGPDLLDPRPQDSENPATDTAPTDPAPAGLVTSVPPGDARTRGSALAEPPTIAATATPAEPETAHSPTVSRSQPNPEPRVPSGCLNPPLHNVHNLHNACTHETTPTPDQPCTCAMHIAPEKNSPPTCIIDSDLPLWPNDDPPNVNHMTLAGQLQPSSQ